MPRPGVTTTVVDDVAAIGPAILTGTAFMVGPTERGPAAVPTRVTSWRQFKERFGGTTVNDMYKSAFAFFNEGGLYLYVVRAVGAGAVAATASQAGWAKFDANGPGIWANGWKVNIDPVNGSNPVRFVVSVLDAANVVKEVSAPLLGADVAAYTGTYVRASSLGTTYLAENAATAVLTLATGAAGAAPIDAEVLATLNTINLSYGPGQVLIPGSRVAVQWAGLADHCRVYSRNGIIDLSDTAVQATLKSDVQTLAAASTGANRVLALGTPINYPGDTPGVVWEVPYSGVQAGIIGRVDGLGDPSLVAAGSDGNSRLALSYKRDFTDVEREDANYSGVSLAKMVQGELRTYGYRVASGQTDANWVFFQEGRVVNAVTHECNGALEEFVFKTIDGRGKLFARVNAALVGICQRYWQSNALYGDTANDAFRVDTSFPGINTPATVALGEIHAQVRLRASRVAEWVVLDIVKVPLERQV